MCNPILIFWITVDACYVPSKAPDTTNNNTRPPSGGREGGREGEGERGRERESKVKASKRAP